MAAQVLEALQWEEEELAEAVHRTLKARDQLVRAQAGGKSDVDLVEMRVMIAEITAAAGHSQLTCGQIDVSGEAAHKNMAAREWKASLIARYTRLQKVLLRLSVRKRLCVCVSSPSSWSAFLSFVCCRAL